MNVESWYLAYEISSGLLQGAARKAIILKTKEQFEWMCLQIPIFYCSDYPGRKNMSAVEQRVAEKRAWARYKVGGDSISRN